MMIVERTVQYFALNVPHSQNEINCKFKMLLDSELIDFINFEATIRVDNVKIVLTQHIDVFQTKPQSVKASDYAGLIEILHDLIKNTAPHSMQTIRNFSEKLAPNAAEPTFFDALRGQDIDNQPQHQAPQNHSDMAAQAAPPTFFTALRSDDAPILNNFAINTARFFGSPRENRQDSQHNDHETNLGAERRL